MPARSLSTHPSTVATVIGAAVLLFAASTMLGWIAGVPALVQVVAGPVMVFNTALCLALMALAVILDDPDSRQKTRIQQGLGSIVIIVAGAVLSQHLFSINPGLDWPALHQWFADDNPYPGRMSRPTALSFLCSATALLLMHRVRSLQLGLVVQILTALPAATAVAALAGLTLELRFVYPDYLLDQMAAPTAISFIAISIALWLRWRGMAWYRSRSILKNEGQRIGLLGAVILTVATSCAVLAGVGATQREIESTISSGLMQALRNNVNLVLLNIDQRLGAATTISSRPRAGEYLLALKARSDDADARRRLAAMAGSFLPAGFSGIAILDDTGREVLRAGQFAQQPEWSLKLKLPHSPHLLWWNGGLVLSVRLPIFSDGKIVGAVLAEQPLPVLTKVLGDIETLGQTSEIGICKLQDGMFHCIPQRLMPRVFSAPYSNALPMSRAIAGETGIILARDYRRQNVIAAHSPIGAHGLGMVVKVDSFELYTPIRTYLNIALLLFLLSSAGGGLILYLRIRPLVAEIEHSREIIREQGAQALRLSENRFAGIIASAMDAIISIDERQRILLFNHAAERMFQYSAAQVIGRPLDMLIPMRLRAAHARHIREFAQSGVTTRSMGRFGTISGLRANGEEFPIEASISQLGVSPDKVHTVILRDISERVRMEEKAKQATESQARLAAIVESSSDAIILRSLDGIVLSWNAAAERLFGWRAAEIIGKPIMLIVPPEQTGIMKPTRDRAMRGETMQPVETIRLRRDGSRFPADITYSPVRDMHGKVIALSNITRDITERKQAEASLRELSRRLLETEEAERRAISRELHDRLGQDLAAAKLNLELIRTALSADSVRTIGTRLDDTLKLVQSMIAHSRNIMAELRPPELDDYGLLAALDSLADTSARRLGIAVRVHGDGAAQRLGSVIEIALYRIAQEALNNVAKHARAGSVDITLASENRVVTLSIADDGAGFDATAAAARGYGLRTMRERAEAAGARFDIASHPGAGTRIAVTVKQAAA